MPRTPAETGRSSRRDGAPRHLVVVGAGFGGLALVRELTGRQRVRGLRVTWVDRHNHHTFQPLLYQVATAGLQPQDIGIPIRVLARRRGVRVRLGTVTAVDPGEHRIAFEDGATLGYDTLVLAAGAITEDFSIPGVDEHAYGLKSLADATTLRNHLLRCFERVSADPSRIEDGTLTFVVAGGGPTGVEVAGALAELVDLVLRRDHPELDVGRVRIVLVELADRLLGGFAPRSSRAAARTLEDRGVELRLGTGIARAHADRVELSDGSVVPTRTLIWAAGVAATPLTTTLGVELARGRRVPVDEHLRVLGLDDVYAVGDLAAGTDAQGALLPQVAQVAIQQGRHVAAHLRGEPGLSAFRYRDKGSMATVGRRSAVTELPGGIRFAGFPAWVAWLGLHLLMLVGFKNRVGVLVSWVWNYVARDHAARLILVQRDAEVAETGHGPVRRRWADAG
jgi:NADH:ubiquinone reductase (H+-translocating)